MDTSKIIIGTVGGGRYTVTAPIVKEDYGLYLKIEGLELPATYEVDFSNSEHNGTSVTMIGNADGVLIPSQFISSGKDVFAFLYHVGADFGRTVYKFRIPNKLRPDRTNEQPTPEEQSVIDQAIAALNEAVVQTAQDVIDAEASAQNASADAERAEEARTDAQNYATQAEQSATDAHESASQASASATASANSASQAEQIKSDVEGMVDDAQASADASYQNAQTAERYARDSATSARQAESYANGASGYESQAQASANTASIKASEASQSAQAASQKATEASQSATDAQTYASNAESAKTDAQTAKTQAETARDEAVTAKTDAESARNEAQNLVDGISEKVEQIDSNTERIESLEDDRYKPYVTDSVSGSIASFPDGADNIPLKSLVVDINPVQDTSSGDPSPENICPISGWTGMQIQHDGTNLFDGEVVNGRYNNGAFVSTGSYRCSKNYIPCYAGMRVFFRDNNNSPLGVFVTIFTASKAFISTTLTSTGRFTIPTDSNARWLRFHVTAVSYESIDGICVSPYDDAYEPYQGQTIPINWETEAGTVYGGTLDMVDWVLTVDRAMVDLGTLNWTYDTSRERFRGILSATSSASTSNPEARTHCLCSIYKTSAVAYNDANRTFMVVCVNTDYVWVRDNRFTDAATFKTAMSGVQLVYELATPIEIQLSANQINSLLGANNIWADTGDTTAEYRADTKLYIEKLTQPEEDDMIADSAITSGQFFMVGNTLFRALANIASGATITVGTNAQRVSLSDALNLVNA